MRRLIALLVGAVTALISVQSAGAGGWQGGDVVGADASSTTVLDSNPPGEAAVTCHWGSDAVFGESGTFERDGNVFLYVDERLWRFNSATGEAWIRAYRVCVQDGEEVSSTLDWRQVTAPDPRVLAESMYDEVVRQVPVPEPALSPVGPGFVNLGMWLAVTEPEPISVTATAGSVWATTSAQLETTTFDMGDGTVVVCDGAGDPIPASQMGSLEPSPICGHTYTGLNGREPFAVTITSTWRVSWTGSGGAGGDLGGLDRTSTLDYEVLEIQTVGN